MTDAERDEFIRYINDQYDLLITKVAYGILKDIEMVHDVKQQVLMKLTPKAHILVNLHPKQITAYVGTTARNAAINEYHKVTAYENGKELIIENYAKSMTMDYVDFKAFEGKYGFGEDLWKLLMELPEMDRELMVYKFYYGMNNMQIAEQFGTNQEQVKKRYQRAKAKLLKKIKERGLDLW